MQRDVVGDLARLGVAGVDPAELDEDADHAPLVLEVLVAVEDAVGRLEAHHATDLDLLAEGAGQALRVLVDRGAVVGLGAEVGVALLEREARETGEGLLEHVALRDEVRLAVQLDERAAVAVDDDLDRTFVRVATFALGRTGQALLPQPVLGRVEVAARLFERASCSPSSRRR